MRHKKIIQEILGKELEKEGFTYVPGESSAWSYERLKDEVWQVISVVRERYCKGYIKIIFNTNAYGQKARELDDFVPEDLPEYWHYETEEELRQIITQFKEWIFAYGMAGLEKMSQPTTEARPKPETNRYLYEHHRELYEEYREKMGIQDEEWIDVIRKIQKRIEETWDLPFSQMEEELIGLAALYAYAINDGKEGNWFWHGMANLCVVEGVTEISPNLIPLKDVILTWKQKRTNILVHKYDVTQIEIENQKMFDEYKKQKRKKNSI